MRPTMDDQLVLDANAVAGDLREIFGVELTMAAHRCAQCGHQAVVGTLRAWVGGPGVVLRCSTCHEVVLRWTRTPRGVRIDLRGAPFLEVPD